VADEDTDLAGPEKAITLLLSIGEERAKSIIAHLDETDIRLLTDTLEGMDAISSKQIESVYRNFGKTSESYALALGTGATMLHRIATQVIGQEKANDLLAKQIEAPEPLHILNRIEAETLAGLLGKEHPQCLAALLAHADITKAAAVLDYLSPDMQRDVVQRMAALESIPHTTIQEAERVLREELALVSEAKVAPIDGVKRAAELVGKLGSEVTERLLEEIDEDNEELCLAIKRAMFTFEDLINVDNRDMQNLLREVSSEQLKFALKTASSELRDHVLGAMSRRASEMLLDDLDGMGPVKLSMVEESQAAVVEIAMKMQNEGKITMSGGGAEEMV